MDAMTAKIYVVGGKEEGESIFLVLYNINNLGQKEVLYTLLVDSFKGIHEFLQRKKEEYNFEHINHVCWTHPHKDHTTDMDEILKDGQLVSFEKNEPSSGTIVAIPDVLCKLICDEHFRLNEKNIAKNILELFHNGFGNSRRCISTHGDFPKETINYALEDKGYDKIVTLRFVTPHFKILKDYLDLQFYDIKPNDYTISLVVDFLGEYSIFLGGDLEENQIEIIDQNKQELIRQCKIVKIPHHGSKHSLNILDFICDELDVVMTTSDRSAGKECLPNEETITEYNKKLKHNNTECTIDEVGNACQVLNTFDIISTDKDFAYGVIETTIAFEEDNISVFNEMYGLKEDLTRK